MPHTLLLADDSVTIQRVIELTFADEDVRVIAVGDGQQAIDRLQRDPPDIVLADVGMPERNGYEVAAFVKETPALAHIPVVLLTGAFEPVDEARARAVGCDGVLVKPFEPQIVISRVKELLAGGRPAGMWGEAPVAQGPVRPASDYDLRVPAAAAPPAAPAPTGDSLEAYFDHLDAAFATGAAPEPPAARTAASAHNEPIPITRRPVPAPAPETRPQAAAAGGDNPFADWDPDLTGDPARPAPPAPAPAASWPAAVPAPAPRSIAPPAPAPPPPPIAPPAPALVAAPPPTPPAQGPLPLDIPSLVDAFAALLAAEQRVGLTPSAAVVPPASASQPAVTDDVIEMVSARVLARLSDESRPSILDVAERLVREEIERIKKTS